MDVRLQDERDMGTTVGIVISSE